MAPTPRGCSCSPTARPSATWNGPTPASTVPGATSTVSGVWSTNGSRVCRPMVAVGELGADGAALKRLVHKTIAQVTVELERLHFNKAVALVRELSNAVEAFAPATDGDRALLREALETIVVLLGPMMPHLAEELWQALGHERLLVETAWPEADPAWTVADSVIVPVQVNGKRRAELELPRGCPGPRSRPGAGRARRAPRHGGQAAAACRRGAGQDRECRRLTPARAGSCWWRCWRSPAAICGRSMAAPETSKVVPDLAAIEVDDASRPPRPVLAQLPDRRVQSRRACPCRPPTALAVQLTRAVQRAGDPARQHGHPLQPDPGRQFHPVAQVRRRGAVQLGHPPGRELQCPQRSVRDPDRRAGCRAPRGARGLPARFAPCSRSTSRTEA